MTNNKARQNKLLREIDAIEEEIGDLEKQLEELSGKKRKTNLIAQTVLEQAAKVMGIQQDVPADVPVDAPVSTTSSTIDDDSET